MEIFETPWKCPQLSEQQNRSFRKCHFVILSQENLIPQEKNSIASLKWLDVVRFSFQREREDFFILAFQKSLLLIKCVYGENELKGYRC